MQKKMIFIGRNVLYNAQKIGVVTYKKRQF